MDGIKKNYIFINSLGRGGAERQISYIVNLPEIEKIICIEPLNVYNIPADKIINLCSFNAGHNLFLKAYQFILVFIKLRKIGIDRNCHLLVFLQLAQIISIFYKKIFGCQVTLCIRTNPFGFYKYATNTKLPFRMFTWLLKSADRLLCNSEQTATDIKQNLGLTQVDTISNGYDIPFISQMKQEPLQQYDSLFSNHPVLINVGRLYYDKGHWHLLRIFKEIKKTNPTVKLVLVGQGPFQEKLFSLCKTLQLTYQWMPDCEVVDETLDVYFLGFQKNPYQFIKASKLFLFTSIFEGLPNALIESLLVGTPVVVTHCPSGPKEIMHPNEKALQQNQFPIKCDYGYLMPPFDGLEVFDNRVLSDTEQLWVVLVNQLLVKEDELATFKSNCKKLESIYNFDEVRKNWSRYLSS